MSVNLTVIEVSGRIDVNGKLSVEETFPVQGPVKVWVVAPAHQDDIDEGSWLSAQSSNPAFADLNDPAEDLYTPNDGKPFNS